MRFAGMARLASRTLSLSSWAGRGFKSGEDRVGFELTIRICLPRVARTDKVLLESLSVRRRASRTVVIRRQSETSSYGTHPALAAPVQDRGRRSQAPTIPW